MVNDAALCFMTRPRTSLLIASKIHSFQTSGMPHSPSPDISGLRAQILANITHHLFTAPKSFLTKKKQPPFISLAVKKSANGYRVYGYRALLLTPPINIEGPWGTSVAQALEAMLDWTAERLDREDWPEPKSRATQQRQGRWWYSVE